MDPREFPTKGNLMLAKNSLALAHQGYDLMDKKRNILLKELMTLIDEAKDIQEKIDTTFTKAYACLQRANIEHGISKVEELAFTVPIEDSVRIQTRSIMGTEIPHVKHDDKKNVLTYSFGTTHESIDIAREAFREVKELTLKLSEVENAAYRLATNIKKTQKRANALKNITIPMYTNLVYTINNALEEKEREESSETSAALRFDFYSGMGNSGPGLLQCDGKSGKSGNRSRCAVSDSAGLCGNLSGVLVGSRISGGNYGKTAGHLPEGAEFFYRGGNFQ